MLGKLGAFERSLENLNEITNETQDYSLMTHEERDAYKLKFGVFSKQTEDNFSKENLLAFEEGILENGYNNLAFH